ncbi:MAG: Type 1 glutamine amidotransferase-like domain-containing protein, partial [bacterium]|nr:Type 1 glutamine amidotransferase-like domain-containing protein [bacterium]
MKLYLSSYGIGNETERFKKLVLKGKLGYIANALDFPSADLERRNKHIEKDLESLRGLGFKVELVDLHDYFGKKDELNHKIEKLGAIFISGGNVFILRQAMKLSGFDDIIKSIHKD